MSLLRPGSKSLVFVTHVDFFRAKCHIFCQVGDVGSQADTVAERVAESVETGTAGPVSSCNRGDLCLALFHSDNSWYRAKVLKTASTSVTVFFIDYGNTETVDISNVRRANDFVLSIPALCTNCIVADCTPLGESWSEEEKKKTETMLLNGEYNIEVLSVEAADTENPFYTVKLYNLEDGSSPIFVRPASSSSLAIPVQRLNVGQSYEVFLSYVESADKFWVQLKDQENDLNSLMADVAACFAEDLPSTGDLINPVKGQLCASCFSEDGAFYRSIVQDLRGENCTVLFVDYGNYEEKSVSELFTLPQVLCKLPMQGIKCSYKADGNKAVISSTLEKYAATDSSYIMTVVASVGHNQYAVQMASVEDLFVPKAPSPKGSFQQKQGAAKVQNSMWQSYQAVFMQVGSIYDVCISHADYPGSFFIQLVANAPALDDLMDSIDKVVHNFEKVSNLYTGCICLAQFGDNAWYRGQILSVKPTTARVGAVDFGQVEELPHGKLKVIPSNYTQLPAQAISCSLDFSKGGREMWTDGECDLFKQFIEKKSLAAKVTSKKGFTYQLDLYEMGDNKERHVNSELNSLPKPTRSFQPAQSQPMQPSPPLPKSKQSLPQPEAAVGSKIVLMFTAVKMPFLYGQLTHTPVKKVAQLQTDLNNYFEKNKGEIQQSTDIGTFCCTQYVDGGWYRGIVVSITGSKIEVAFADFGDSVLKTPQDLKALPAHLLELPQQCILFKAENVPALTREKAEKMLINTKVEVTLTRKEENAFPTFSGQINSRQVLEKLQDRAAPSQGVFKGASSRTFGSSRQPKDVRPSTPSDSGFSQQQVTVGSSQEVMVTYVKDPSNFMVVLDKMNSSLDIVMEQMHEFYDVLPPDGERLENPCLGQPCVAQFSEDKAWYRAVVTGLKSSGPAEVMYVDYGNNEYTDREALKNIKPQYMNLPAQAILCCLSGVASAQGFWSPEHIVQFEEMVVEQSFMANFCSSFHEQGQLVHKVELLDKKGKSINQKFGTMTNTLSMEKDDTSQSSKGFGASNMGPDMRITVNIGDGDSGWDESEDTRQVGFGNKGSFGGRQERGAGDAAFGGRPERGGFGGGSRGGGYGRSEGGRPERSFGGRSDRGGFGNRSENQGFRSSGGFGGGGELGFGKKSDNDSFGRQGGSGGFSSRSDSSGFGERSGGGGSTDCFKYRESGHISRDCPNALTRGGGGGRECFKCGEAGHMARDCPNPGKGGGGGGGRGGRECFKCGEGGHMARDCSNPGKGGDRRGGGFNSDSREDRRGGGFGAGGSSGDRQTGGFGGRSGGFGNKPDFGGNDRGFASNSTDEDWGNSDGGAGQKGFGRSDSGAGQKGFGNRSGGFGQGTGKSEGFGNRSGGFGKGGGAGFGGNAGAGGFGSATEEEDDWGADDTVTQPQQLGTAGSIGATRQTTEVNNETVMEGCLQVYELEVHDAVDVYVVYTNSPDQFWCQVIKSSKQLENMMEEMNAVYESLEGTDLNLVNPDVGMPCAAKFSEDNMWYRAEIITPNEEEIEVLFLDYGNTEIIPASNMKVLKPEFMKLKAQGLRCSLDGVLPTNKLWTDKASQCFEELTIDKHLLAKVMNTTSSGTYLVDLENVDDKINVAEILAEKGFCSFSLTKPAAPVKKEFVISPYPSLDIKAGEEVDVYLSWIENPEQFWVQVASRENTLLELVDKVQEEYTAGSGASMKVSSLKVGDAVMSPYSEDGAWYRGFVEDIDGDDCSIRFTDYGNSDKVSKDSLRLPTDELLAAPSEAAYCKLTGIRPLQSGSWTADAKDIMDSLVKDLLVKCKVAEMSNKQFSVTLFANDVDISKELINAAVAREEKEQSVQAMDIQEPSKVGMVLTFRENGSLQTGASEKVYVAHTDSVASFWCQPVKTVQQLEELMTKLESHCQSAPAAQKPRVGAACAAKFSEDAQWYRAKVIAAYPDSVEVLFVDYGNCEKVSNTDLCQLSEELVELEPQAIQCELENVSNASNQLTAKFTELVGDQEVAAKVIDVQEGMATVTMTLPDGRSVDAELGLSKVAEVLDVPTKQEEKIGIPTSYPKQVVPKIADVFISHVNTLADFYVHRADQEEQLNELMEKIAESYETADMLQVESISKGEICCCLFTEDGAWYRAQVKDVDENKIKVRYVDYGNEEEVTIDSIKNLSSKFISLAPFALQCSLSEVKPVQSQWSEDAVEKFKSLTADQVLGCEFISEAKVKLTLDGIDIAEKLTESDHCVMEGKQSEATDDILLFSPQSVPTESVPCYVSHISTTGEVYIQLVSEEESLSNITEKIQNVEKDEPLDLMSVRIKQCLCARFCEDQSWYRSMVTAVKEGAVEVLFVDYGNKQSVTESSDLRPLNKEDVVNPPLAYACRLSGVKQLNEDQIEILRASTADKELTVTFLSTESVFEVNLTDENGDRIEKVLEGHHDGGSVKYDEVEEITEAISTVTVAQYPASSGQKDELQDNTSITNVISAQEDTGVPDVDDGDASKNVVDEEPDKDVIHKEPDQKESLEHTVTDTGVETITDAISKVTVENVEGSPKEMLNKSAEEITPVDEESEQGIEEDSSANHINLENMITSEDQLEKQTLSSDKRVKVVVSHSDSPSRLWVQDIQFQPELDDLLNKMFEFYSSCTDDRLMLDEIREGQIVAALYSEDESWYRAKVMSVKDEDCMVMFLDHGNTETVMRENIRKLPLEFASLPVQGILCTLGAIQPSGGEWSEEAIAEFHTLTQDKELLMDVSSQEDGVYKVSLLDMGMSLNTLLMEKGVGAEEATPVAINTKVKQVFSPDNQEVIAQLYVAKASESHSKYGYVVRDLSEFLTSNQTVVVTDINSPHDFTCRLEDDTYEYYQDKLVEAYAVKKEELQDPKQGDKCVVKLEKNDKFYHRASIISVNQDKINVMLVDKGIEASVTTANLYALETDFEKDPALAFQCSLSAVVPVKDAWSEQSTLVFREALLEFSSKESLPVFAKAQIVSVEAEAVNVELYLGKTSMDDVLIKKEVAVLNDIDKTIDENDTSDLVIDRFGVFQNVILDCDKDHYVNLDNCDNLDEIVVHTSQGLNIVKEITETIEEFTKSKSEGVGLSDDYSSGPCLARSNGAWCRANLLTVTSKKEEKYYQVFLVDYGTEYAVKRKDIMALPEDLLKIPGQAVICHLDEIEPFEAEWGEDSLELFKTHYLSDEADIVIYVCSYNNGYHSVVLTKASETESANKMLVELGFASPVAGSSLEMSVMIDNAETSFQEVSLMREDSYGESDGLGDASALTETSTDTAVSDAERSTDTVEEKDSATRETQHSEDETLDETSIEKKEKVSKNTCDINGIISQDTFMDNCASENILDEHACDMKGFTEFHENEPVVAEPLNASCGMSSELDSLVYSENSTTYRESHVAGSRNEITDLENSTTDCKNTSGDIENYGNETTDLEKNTTELENTTASLENDSTANGNITTDLENGITEFGNTSAEFENHACNYQSETTDLESSYTDFEKTADDFESSTTEFESSTTEFENTTTEFENSTTDHVNESTDLENSDMMFEDDASNLGNASTDLENSDMMFEDDASNLGNATADYENVTNDLGNATADFVDSKIDCDNSAADFDTSTTDVNPRSTEESDLDESYLRLGPCSPTGYTTSDLDTTDLRDIDSTDIDATDMLADTSLFTEDDPSYDSENTAANMTDDVVKLNGILYDKERKDMTKSVLIDTDENAYQEMMFDIDIDTENIEGTELVAVSEEFEKKSISDEDQVVERRNEIKVNDQIEMEKDRYYPSISDTTYPSTISSTGDATFTSIGESTETETDSLLICMDCNTEVSSCLETTGCESEFSFHVCPVCKTWDNEYTELEFEAKDNFITNVDHEEIVPSSVPDVLGGEYAKDDSSQCNGFNDPDDMLEVYLNSDRTSTDMDRKNVVVCEVSNYPLTGVLKNSEDHQGVGTDEVMGKRDDIEALVASENDEVIDKDHIYSLKEIEGFNEKAETKLHGTDSAITKSDFVDAWEEPNEGCLITKPKLTCKYSPSGTDVDSAYFNMTGNTLHKSRTIEDSHYSTEEPIKNKDESTKNKGKDNEIETKKSLVTKFFSFILPKKDVQKEVFNTNNSCSSLKMDEEYVDIPEDQSTLVDPVKGVNPEDSPNAESEDSLKDMIESNEDNSQKSENYFTCELEQTEDEENDMDDYEIVETVLFSIVDDVSRKSGETERYFEGENVDFKDDHNPTIISCTNKSEENEGVKDTLIGFADFKSKDRIIGGCINEAEEIVDGKDLPIDDVSAKSNSIPVKYFESVQTICDSEAFTESTGISTSVSHSDLKTNESECKTESVVVTNVQNTENVERHMFAENVNKQESGLTNSATNQSEIINITNSIEEDLPCDGNESKIKSDIHACFEPDELNNIEKISLKDNDNFESAESTPLHEIFKPQYQEQAEENIKDNTKERNECGFDVVNLDKSSAKCLPALGENKASEEYLNPYSEVLEDQGDDSPSTDGMIETKDTTEQVKVTGQAVENGIKDPEGDDDSDKDDFEDADDKIKASREGSLEKGTKEEEGEDFYDVQEDVKE